MVLAPILFVVSLVGFSVARFAFQATAPDYAAGEEFREINADAPSSVLGEPSGAEQAARLINIFFSLLGICSIFVFPAIGLILVLGDKEKPNSVPPPTA